MLRSRLPGPAALPACLCGRRGQQSSFGAVVVGLAGQGVQGVTQEVHVRALPQAASGSTSRMAFSRPAWSSETTSSTPASPRSFKHIAWTPTTHWLDTHREAHCLHTQRVVHLRGRVGGPPRPWSGCRLHRDATITTAPPPRHMPHQCIPRPSQHGNALHHRTHCPITARPRQCVVGATHEVVAELPKTGASKNVPPTQWVYCKDFSAWIVLENRARPSFAAASMRRPCGLRRDARTVTPSPRRRCGQ